jgi:non-ribosomal peptide synthase protein (TIGR01720 family)
VYELGPEDRVLQFGSISADIVISQLFPAWISGSAVVFPDSRLPESLDAFLDFLESKRLSVLDLPTAFWLRWVLELAQTGKTLPKSLRMVIAGGEQAPMKAYETWLQMAGTRVRFLHAYGPTETTVAACAYDPIFGTRSHEWDLEIPIGRALENVRLYVLGQGLQPVSIGMPGELYIGGAGLARGYLGQPGLTAEVFVPDPFCGVAGDRMYKSGDRVRLLQSGDIEFMGRVDEQVKIRGNRVELGEIEAVLSQHPDVRQAIVLARTQGDNEKRLAAYLVVDDEARCDITALRSYLRQRVPEYQIPSTFSFLRALPITATGKVDRKALLSLRDAEAVEQKEVVSPGNETEKMLADIWSELLQTPAIGIHDNFFELGGDSLIGLQMVARGRGRGLEIKSQDVFRYQTIAEMAVVVEGRRREGGEGREKEKVGEVGGEVKLTAIQRWFVEQGFAEREHYNQSLLLEAGAEVKYEGVAEVVRKLVEHHDGLRLRLRREGGEWRQENAAEEKAEIFERVEAGGRSRKEQEQVLRETGERLQKGMNLERGPIVRGAMVERGGKEGSWVMLVVHHWAVDNLSWRILVEDLERGYEQWQRREGVDFGEKTASFQQWAAAAEGYGKSEQVKEELEYWKGEVERGREGGGEIGEEEGGGENVVEWERRVVVEMDEGETRGLLEEVTQWHRAQTQEVLLAGVWEGFRRWEGRRVLRLEVEGHGREEVLGGGLDVTRTVGWFTAQYPMVVEGGEEWRETLQRVKQQWRKVPGRGVGYGLLRYVREEAEIREVLGGDGQVSFNYFGQMSVGSSGGRFRMLGAAPGEGQSRRARRPYLLDLTLMVIAGRLNLQVGYSEKVHRQQNIEQLAGHVMQALRDLLEYSRSAPLPAFSPSDFPLARLNDAELASLTVKLTGLPENE